MPQGTTKPTRWEKPWITKTIDSTQRSMGVSGSDAVRTRRPGARSLTSRAHEDLGQVDDAVSTRRGSDARELVVAFDVGAVDRAGEPARER